MKLASRRFPLISLLEREFAGYSVNHFRSDVLAG